MYGFGRKNGFTLIELLVVVAIVGLLSSVVLSSLNQARGRARDARRIQDLAQINNALALYADDNGGSYPDPAPGNDAVGPSFQPDDNATSVNVDSDQGPSRWPAPGYQDHTTLTLLLAPYIKLPLDPLNQIITGYGSPAVGTAYGYYYHYNTETNDYDLIAVLETPSHPASCGVMRAAGQPYMKKAWFFPGIVSWCPTEGDPTDNIYAVR